MPEENDQNHEQEAQEPKYSAASDYRTPEYNKDKGERSVQLRGGASDVLEERPADTPVQDLQEEVKEQASERAEDSEEYDQQPEERRSVMYLGHRPIVPPHGETVWVQSAPLGAHWELRTAVAPLDGMPTLEAHRWEYTDHESPHAYSRFVHSGGHEFGVPAPKGEKYEYKGVPATEIFPTKTQTWGQERVIDAPHLGVDSARITLGGDQPAPEPNPHPGITPPPLEGGGTPATSVTPWNGVPSARIL